MGGKKNRPKTKWRKVPIGGGNGVGASDKSDDQSESADESADLEENGDQNFPLSYPSTVIRGENYHQLRFYHQTGLPLIKENGLFPFPLIPNASQTAGENDGLAGCYIDGLWIPNCELPKYGIQVPSPTPPCLVYHPNVPWICIRPVPQEDGSQLETIEPQHLGAPLQHRQAPGQHLAQGGSMIPSNAQYLLYLTRKPPSWYHQPDRGLPDDGLNPELRETYWRRRSHHHPRRNMNQPSPYWRFHHENQILPPTMEGLEGDQILTPPIYEFLDESRQPEFRLESTLPPPYVYPGYSFGQPVFTAPVLAKPLNESVEAQLTEEIKESISTDKDRDVLESSGFEATTSSGCNRESEGRELEKGNVIATDSISVKAFCLETPSTRKNSSKTVADLNPEGEDIHSIAVVDCNSPISQDTISTKSLFPTERQKSPSKESIASKRSSNHPRTNQSSSTVIKKEESPSKASKTQAKLTPLVTPTDVKVNRATDISSVSLTSPEATIKTVIPTKKNNSKKKNKRKTKTVTTTKAMEEHREMLKPDHLNLKNVSNGKVPNSVIKETPKMCSSDVVNSCPKPLLDYAESLIQDTLDHAHDKVLEFQQKLVTRNDPLDVKTVDKVQLVLLQGEFQTNSSSHCDGIKDSIAQESVKEELTSKEEDPQHSNVSQQPLASNFCSTLSENHGVVFGTNVAIAFAERLVEDVLWGLGQRGGHSPGQPTGRSLPLAQPTGCALLRMETVSCEDERKRVNIEREEKLQRNNDNERVEEDAHVEDIVNRLDSFHQYNSKENSTRQLRKGIENSLDKLESAIALGNEELIDFERFPVLESSIAGVAVSPIQNILEEKIDLIEGVELVANNSSDDEKISILERLANDFAQHVLFEVAIKVRDELTALNYQPTRKWVDDQNSSLETLTRDQAKLAESGASVEIQKPSDGITEKPIDAAKVNDTLNFNKAQLPNGPLKRTAGHSHKFTPSNPDGHKEKYVDEATASYLLHLLHSDIMIQETELELNRLKSRMANNNHTIYKLAYDEIESDPSGSEEEFCQPLKELPVPRVGLNLPIRTEISVHDADTASDAGSEDVELNPHSFRFENSPARREKHGYINKLSLAAELLKTHEDDLPYDEDFKPVSNTSPIKIDLSRSKVVPVEPSLAVPVVTLAPKPVVMGRFSIGDSGVQSDESENEGLAEEAKEDIVVSIVEGQSAGGKVSASSRPARLKLPKSGLYDPCYCCAIM